MFIRRDIEKTIKNLIEIIESTSPSKPTKNFNVLSKYNQPIMPGLVIDNTDKIRPINNLAYSFPVSLIGV